LTVLPIWQHAAKTIPQGTEISHDDGPHLNFHDPLGSKIAKDIFNIPRVTHAAGDGEKEAGEHPVVLLHLVENVMDFRKEELFASVCTQRDDGGNYIGKVRQKDRHNTPPGIWTRLGQTPNRSNDFFYRHPVPLMRSRFP
jgi:hypothetical protein